MQTVVETVQFEAELLNTFKARYQAVHPMIFWRSVERARTPGDLFDILEGCPKDFPIVWSEDEHRWKVTGCFPIL